MSTTPSPSASYLAALRGQLDAAGTPALEMLAERAPLDAVILLAAIEATGLLTAATADEVDALRVQIDRAARRSPLPDAVVRDHLALAPMAWPADEDSLEREGRVHRLLALASLQPYVSTTERWRLTDVLDDAQARIVAEPARFADLSGLATFLEDQLDLPTQHPATQLLTPLRRARTFAAAPLPADLLQQALAGARAQVAALSRRTWREVFAAGGQSVVDFFDRLTHAPVLAVAADAADLPPLTDDGVVLWSDDGRGEVSLVATAAGLQVEWFGEAGETPPLQVRLRSDAALPAVEAPFDGARRWVLPELPPEGARSLVLDFGDARVVIPPEGSDDA